MGIYEELGVPRLTNARCILGRYGDSLPSAAVLEAMVDAANDKEQPPRAERGDGKDGQLASAVR
jgi:hypothetical protein